MEFVLSLLLIIIDVCDELDPFVVRDIKASQRATNNLSYDDDDAS